MYCILGGLGQQGLAITRYLLRHTQERVDIADLTFKIGMKLPQDLEDGRKAGQLGLCTEYQHLLDTHSDISATYVNCLPIHLGMATILLQKEVNFVDLGGDEKFAQDLLKSVYKRPNIVVPDCGLAPGFASTLAGHVARTGGTELSILCGGLPLCPADYHQPRYVRSFSVHGLLNEYTGLVAQREYGELCHVPALDNDETEWRSIEGLDHSFEAAPTYGSMSITPQVSELHYLNYRTLRYEGHFEWMKENIFWQKNPAEILEGVLEAVGPEDQDTIILRAEYDTVEDMMTTVWQWKYDTENDISAMAQATGYIVAAVATMIHDKALEPGVNWMHNIAVEEIIMRVQKEPNQFTRIYHTERKYHGDETEREGD